MNSLKAANNADLPREKPSPSCAKLVSDSVDGYVDRSVGCMDGWWRDGWLAGLVPVFKQAGGRFDEVISH